MKNLQELMKDVLDNGQRRETRSGVTYSVFDRKITFDMRKRFPAPTTKKLMFKAVVGEGLLFANGLNDLPSLRKLSCLEEDAWTIWTNDCYRWHGSREAGLASGESLGLLYGHQWRAFGRNDSTGFPGVDQLQGVVDKMKNDPYSRYMIVAAYNPLDVYHKRMALPPCHTGFTVYVDRETGEFDLKWRQRSVDVFLGLPFNIASYAWLMEVLGSITGLQPRFLIGDLDDTHIYELHVEAVDAQLERDPLEQDTYLDFLKINSLDDLKYLTADDFHLQNYNPMSAIRAPLLVGL